MVVGVWSHQFGKRTPSENVEILKYEIDWFSFARRPTVCRTLSLANLILSRKAIRYILPIWKSPEDFCSLVWFDFCKSFRRKKERQSNPRGSTMRVFGFFISAISVSACDLFPVDYGFGESIYHRAEYFFRNRCFRTLNDGEFHKFGALTDFVLDGSGYYR